MNNCIKKTIAGITVGMVTLYTLPLYAFASTESVYSKLKSDGESYQTIVTTKDNDDEAFEREKSIINAILEELCVRQYEYENVEGDDIIAYYVKNKKPNEKVVIVSSDKDLTQLISDTVIVYNPRMRDFVTKDNSVEKIGKM